MKKKTVLASLGWFPVFTLIFCHPCNLISSVFTLKILYSCVKARQFECFVILQDKVENMSKRYDIMKQRYTDLEKRRNLEVEGFKNDIKSLRKQLKDMEKQLYKVCLPRFNIDHLDPIVN